MVEPRGANNKSHTPTVGAHLVSGNHSRRGQDKALLTNFNLFFGAADSISLQNTLDTVVNGTTINN